MWRCSAEYRSRWLTASACCISVAGVLATVYFALWIGVTVINDRLHKIAERHGIQDDYRGTGKLPGGRSPTPATFTNEEMWIMPYYQNVLYIVSNSVARRPFVRLKSSNENDFTNIFRLVNRHGEASPRSCALDDEASLFDVATCEFILPKAPPKGVPVCCLGHFNSMLRCRAMGFKYAATIR